MAANNDLGVVQLRDQSEAVSIETPVLSNAATDTLGNTNRPIVGFLFQLKVALIFLLRGIRHGYQFRLGIEIKKCGKFDDIVFEYDVTTGDQCLKNNRFIQTKSKQDEENYKISSEDLLYNDSGNFSIAKYFISYCPKIINRSAECPGIIKDIIILTNSTFDEDELKRNGIELVPHNDLVDNILSFEKLPNGKVPLRYKLKNTKFLRKKLKEIKIYFLAEKLINCETKGIVLSLKDELIKNCHLALVKEKVIYLPTKKLHGDFISGKDLSNEARELRRILRQEFNWKKDWNTCKFKMDVGFGLGGENQLLLGPLDEEIDSFLDKFVWAVNSPNEVELDAVLKTELGHYYNLKVIEGQFRIFFTKMLDWFKKKDSHWMTSDEGIHILDDIQKEVERNRVSILMDYQNETKEMAEFNDATIRETSEKLKPFLMSSDSAINYMTTVWPVFTAVKVIAAIKTLPSFKCSDSYMIISAKKAQKEENFQNLREIFSEGKPHHLLIVVCEDHNPISYDTYTNLVAYKEKKKILVIVKKGMEIPSQDIIHEDDITFGQFCDTPQNNGTLLDIFKFIFDCLDMKIDPPELRRE